MATRVRTADGRAKEPRSDSFTITAVRPSGGAPDWISVAAIPGQFADSSGVQWHGLPMSLVEKGDPYPKQIERR